MRAFSLTLLFCICLYPSLSAQRKRPELKHSIYNDLYLTTSVYRNIVFKRSYLSTMNIGASFYPHDRFSFGPDLAIYRFWDPQYSSLGIGIGPAIRTYPIRREKFALYIEWKGAVVFMFPEYRSRSRNFTYTNAIGSDIAISEKLLLRSAIGYHHFSNARYYDHNNNSAADALGGYIGIVYKPK